MVKRLTSLRMSHFKNLKNNITSLRDLESKVHAYKKDDKKIVFTNGCFDILHLGHVEYLSKAADFGDVLILGMNSDASVKRQGKGEDRPINISEARATLLAALSFVDLIIEFDEDTPLSLIQLIEPDVLIKGGDYDPKESDSNSKKYIVGREQVLKEGGVVEVINLTEGYSTTAILEKSKK